MSKEYEQIKKKMKNLRGERLILSPWEKTVGDAQGLYSFAKSENVGPKASWKPHESLEESYEIIENIFLSNIAYKIVDIKDEKIIGNITLERDIHRPEFLSLELGYALNEMFWGKGYMVEASKLLLQEAFFNWNIPIISAQTDENNKQSQRVLEKIGMICEGRRRMSDMDYKGNIRNVMLYSILKEEYK